MSSIDKMGIGDSVSYVLSKETDKSSSSKIPVKNNVHAVLRGPDNEIKWEEWGGNLVTDYGDDVIATRLFDDAVEIVTGMRLSTATTAEAKNGAGSYNATGYISASQQVLDGVATDATKGAGAGWRTTYVTTWAAGDVTNATINSVVLTNETALTDTAGVAADTLARYVFGATIDKQAGDSLEVTWQIDVQGAP
jgi:hypothetical protein